MINNGKRFALAAIVAVCTFSISDISQQSYALTNAGSITALGASLTEDFNTLPITGTSSTLPAGWLLAESGTNANTTYTAGTGSSTSGDTYSFGSASSSDRALGGLLSGSLNPTIGARFTNDSGATITSLTVSYTGEQWRFGQAARGADRLDFQYSTTASSLTTGTWIDVDTLDFSTPNTAAAVGATDGNASANRLAISATISGLTIPNGAAFYIRWADFNVTGSDDGLAIDDFSIVAQGSGGGDSAPTVSMTTPSDNAANVGVDTGVTLTFSEAVNTDDGAFAIQCGSSQSFTSSATSGTAITLTPANSLPYSTACTVSVDKDKVHDQDSTDPPDTMTANGVFHFTTASAPQPLTASSPQAGAASLDPAANITINFSRSVTAPSSAFSVNCGNGVSIGVSGSPGTSITLDPVANLPFSTDCLVTADRSQIFAAQAPTQMASDFSFAFHTAAKPVATNVMINEVDADTPGDDRAEFIELYDGGAGNTDLSGLVVVLYNGSSTFSPNPFEHQSYASFDLDGKTTDANGYFVLGNPDVPGVGLPFDPGQFGLLQNGADAVALYVGHASDFPNGTPSSGALPTTGLIDAVVYDTDDADDNFLKTLLNTQQPQVNENASGDGQHQSVARCGNGTGGMRNTSTYLPTTPSPGAANVCPASRPPSDIVISQVYGGGGNSGATYQNDYVQLFNRGSGPVDIGGWSLQYASALGTSWTNKQPLGGIINAGEYYLIGLASGGSAGAPLADPDGTPADQVPSRKPNISGAINMSAANGKIALVSSGESLVGSCPIFNPTVVDFVGYGTATATDCGEGGTKAPAITNTTADFRKSSGNQDTDNNLADFATGAPNPFRTAPIQELPPFLFQTDPPSGGVNVPRDPTIVLTFTEAVDVDPGWYAVSCDSGDHSSASVAGSGQFKDITLNDALTPGEHCTVSIDHTKVHDHDTDDSSAFYDLLPDDVSWTFTVASGTAPPYPADVHLAFGNPSGAIADLNSPNNYLMMKPEFSLSYDRDLGRPNWVSWHLSSEWTGSLTRVDTFRADPAIPDDPDWYRVESFDFSGSGFDRGHMTPNADRDKETSIPINQATFLMTNMVAQAPDNNQGPWAAFEGYLRTLTDPGSTEIYIVAGPSGVGGTGSNGGSTTTIANGHVTVPSATWKVALVLPKGDDDLSRVTCSTKTIAVLMPNVQGIRNDAWENYLTNVDAIEDLTGYDFFSNLPTQIQQCIEAGTNGDNPPLDSEPPAITCDAPDGMWHSDNISLACHAVDTASGLAHQSDASFTLMTSVVGGAETASALTDTRTVCDKAGNCATAGPIAGNMIDRKLPSISLTSPSSNAVYQLNRSVIASFACTDAGSGAASCVGTAANGTPVDTASTGAKAFTVNAIDAAGNAASTTVAYTVLSNTVSISNVPTSLMLRGDSFVPTFNYAGDGATSVTSLTLKQCTVENGSVVFQAKGTCTIMAHATATATFDAADGVPQSFEIDSHKLKDQ